MSKRNKDQAAVEAEPTNSAETADKASRSRTPKTAVIRIKAEKNPKREGSSAHQRFALYKDGMTVGEFLEAGGTMGDINFDSNKGFIALEGVESQADVAEAA